MKLKAINNYWINLILGALILNWVTYYNGFPIIYNDTATYIKSGFNLDTPADRPITYGIFILITSLKGISLFLTVFFQNLILSWLLLECFVKSLGVKFLQYFLLTIALLSLFTGLSWISNQIFADLFTSFIFLSAFLILTYSDERKSKLYFLYFIYFLSVGSHLSHISITQIFLYVSLPIVIFIAPKSLNIARGVIIKRGITLIVIGLMAILIMGAAISKSSPIFFTGKLCENGILKKYLDENCGAENYRLCQYKDELNYPAVDFVWNPNCATLKLGGWKAVRDEYDKIDKAIIGNPKYLKMLITESIKSSVQQFSMNNIGEGNYRLLNDSNNTSTILKYYSRDEGLYYSSKESSNNGIDFAFFNSIYNKCYIAFVLLFVVFFIKKTIQKQFDVLYILAVMIVIGTTVNNVMSASLANAINRFGVRVSWLMVFVTLLMIVQILQKSEKSNV